MPLAIALVVGFLVLEALLTIATIGKPRRPFTPGDAVLQVVVVSLLIWAIVAHTT